MSDYVIYTCVYLIAVFAFIFYACRTAELEPNDPNGEDEDKRPCDPPITVRDLLAWMQQDTIAVPDAKGGSRATRHYGRGLLGRFNDRPDRN